MPVYVVGTGLDIPGLEAIMELGQVSDLSGGAVDLGLMPDGTLPTDQRINDRSVLEQVRVTQIDGLYDDPEAQDLRTKLPDRHGELAGLMSYAGKTIGLTGTLVAGSIISVRDLNRRMKATLKESEQALVIHVPGEVPQYCNVAPDPLVTSGGTVGAGTGPWTVANTSGTANVTSVVDGVLTAGSLTVTSATGAGSAVAAYSSLYAWLGNVPGLTYPPIRPWRGEDLWVHGRVKVQSATAAVTSLQVDVVCYSPTGVSLARTITVATQASPTTGTWYALSGVVTAAQIRAAFPDAVAFSTAPAINYSAAGTYEARFTRLALVPIPANAIAPVGYFDGTFPGFEWDGAAPARSRGPAQVVNQVSDPLALAGTNWTDASIGSPTVSGPTQVPAGSGLVDDQGRAARGAVYYSATNPTASSRTLALATNAASGKHFVVAAGRTYQVGVSLNVLSAPAASAVGVVWLDQSGAAISTSAVGPALTVGIVRYATAMTAPAGAVSAYMQVSVTTSVSGARLQVFASRATFCDSTEHGVSVVGDEQWAVLDGGTPSSGARGSIKRPFLMRNVRKTSYQCPETQKDARTRRDYTLSLRAADPRIYRLDEHNEQLTMTGTSSYTGVLAFLSLVAAGAQSWTVAPTGFSFDTTPTYNVPWQQGSTGGVPSSYVYAYPNQGVGTPASQAAATARFYYGAFTYQQPHVEMACTPSPFSFNYAYNTWSKSVGAIVKRTSATNYIEVRWNSVAAGSSNAAGGSYTGHEVEIWVNTGSGAVLRGGFDNGHTLDNAPYNLVCYLDASNVVHAELVPIGVNTTSAYTPYASVTYQLASAEITALGTAVSGNSGALAVAGQTINGVVQPSGAISSLSFRRHDATSPKITIPVLGDVDTAPVIVLRGGLQSPTLSLLDADGESSMMAFSDTFDLPTTIDYGRGTILDSAGQNRFPGLLTGSSMRPLKPGANTVVLQAINWGTGPHAIVWWRDARK